MLKTELPPVKLELLPHHKAPMLQRPDGYLTLLQVFAEVASGNFPTKIGEFHDLFRQCCLSNLWFFLRFVAAYNGPYEKLTPHLHVEMANFYQSEVMVDASKTAGFIPRFHYKSSIWTHGANSWELIRDPNLSIGLASGVYDRSIEFLHFTQQTFTTNPLFAWLFPDFHVKNPRSVKGWTDELLTLPNKTFNPTQPNIKPITVGGATQSIHVDCLKMDDVIGDSQLNADRSSGSEMRRITNWVFTNMRTLVKEWKTSRVFITGTRYAMDDTYEPIMKNTGKCYGCWHELNYELREDGEWTTYYRMAKEKEGIIFPEAITQKGLDDMLRTDPWGYYTQMQNNPMIGGLNDFVDCPPKECKLDFDNRQGWYVTFMLNRELKTVYINDCDLLIAADPAASNSKTSARTSRSSVVVYARDWENRRYLLKVFADYVDAVRFIDWLFTCTKIFPTFRGTFVEMQGPFKLLGPVINEEENRRKEFISLRGVSAQGDKIARIRTAIGPLLTNGMLYVVDSIMPLFWEEAVAFPGGSKLDILDSVSIAERASVQPSSPESREEAEIDDILEEEDRNPIGY